MAAAGRAALFRRRIDVARNEARGEAEAAHGFDHQHGEVAAASAAERQGLQGRLRLAVQAGAIGELAVDRVGHVAQQGAQAGLAHRTHESARPGFDLAARIGMLPLHRLRQVRQVVGAVVHGQGRPVAVVAVQAAESRLRRMLQPDLAVEADDVGAALEARDADAVAEHVMDRAHHRRVRRNRQVRRQQPLVIALQRPQHHAMLAERHRVAVAVGSQVSDGDDGH